MPNADIKYAGLFAVVVSDRGLTAVLDTGRVQIVVISDHVDPHDLAAFTAVGTGARTSDYAALGLHKVRRPIHPIAAI